MIVGLVLSGLIACGSGEAAGPARSPVPTLPIPSLLPAAVTPARAARGPAPAKKLTTKGNLPKVADPCAAWSQPGLYDFQIPFDGKGTSTLVYVPPGPGPHPTAFVLHGGSGDSDKILEQTDILAIADASNLVVVAPTGAGGATEGKGNWNMHDSPGMLRDDVKYLDTLARRLREHTCGGPDVLVVGFSNGSMMAQRWLCQGEEPDAALVATGRMPVDPSTCKGPRPIRSYVGTDDEQYKTGQPTTPVSLDMWARINGCKLPAKETRNGAITARTWDGCRADTLQFVMDGWPHAFPRGPSAPLDAIAEGWPWFVRVTKGR